MYLDISTSICLDNSGLGRVMNRRVIYKYTRLWARVRVIEREELVDNKLFEHVSI